MKARSPDVTPEYLVVQHQEDSTPYIHVSWPLHLEAVRLLGSGGPVPLQRGRCQGLLSQRKSWGGREERL